MGNHLFICYAREDWDFVQKIATKLKEAGILVWLDRWDIAHGANWNKTRDNALYDAAQCLVILSPAAIDSEQVEAEWVTALEEKKHLVPILYQPCRIPSRLRLIQHFDFTKGGLENAEILWSLVRALGGSQETSDPQPTRVRHSRADGNPEGRQETGELVSQQPSPGKAKDQTKGPEKPKIIPPPPLSEITNSIGMKFILIPAGEFLMGSENSGDDETPVRRVQISKPFYLGKYPVTQAQWRAVMGNNPSRFQQGGWFREKKDNPDHPVERVSWEEAQEFLRKLSEHEGGKTYRLPTEAEWEYACRAGSTRAYGFGDDEAKLKEYAWYNQNSGNTTHMVGQLKPNDWGLYDMHGNVWECVQDWYVEGYYQQKRPNPDVDPQGPDIGGARSVRGGSWANRPRLARASSRFRSEPGNRNVDIGFRCAQ